MHKLKNRIVNFRVTDEELALLKTASNLHGARCLSDFARTVMLETAGGPASTGNRDEEFEAKIQSLDCRLTEAEADLSGVMSVLYSEGKICPKSKD